MVHVAAAVDGYAKNDEYHDCDYLQEAEPVFYLAVCADDNDICADYGDPED